MRIRWLRNSACRNIFKKRQGVEICDEWCLRPRSGAVGPSAKPVICRAMPWFVRLEKMNVDLVMNLFCCFFNVISGSTSPLHGCVHKEKWYNLCFRSRQRKASRLWSVQTCVNKGYHQTCRESHASASTSQALKHVIVLKNAFRRLDNLCTWLILKKKHVWTQTRALCKFGKHRRCNLHAPENMSISKFLNHMGGFDHILDHCKLARRCLPKLDGVPSCCFENCTCSESLKNTNICAICVGVRWSLQHRHITQTLLQHA